ncbi:MAG: endonuclease III [Ignavibacteriales bacterium]|nr:endonuclease III [Ignavibacteriales bacterium]
MKRKDISGLQNKISRIADILDETLGVPIRPQADSKPLDMLIATILSQNTNDKNSFRAYTQLRKQFPSWKKVAEASVQSIASAIKSGGMANQKSRRIKEVLQNVRVRFGGYSLEILNKKSNDEVMEILLAFNGVGAKTAACVLLFSLKREVFPVDTHIHRIAGRLGISGKSRTPDESFAALNKIVPDGKAYSFHTNLIRFGRKICRATNPLCGSCPLFRECEFNQKQFYKKKSLPECSDREYNFMILDNVG